MTKRDRDRRNEHAPHGWRRSSEATHDVRPGQVYVRCPCGWFGWIAADVAPLVVAAAPGPSPAG